MLHLSRAEHSETLHRTSNFECVQNVKCYVWEGCVFVFPPIHVPTKNGHAMVSLLLVVVSLFKIHCNMNHNQYVASMTGTNSRVPFGVGSLNDMCQMQCTLFSLKLFAVKVIVGFI